MMCRLIAVFLLCVADPAASVRMRKRATDIRSVLNGSAQVNKSNNVPVFVMLPLTTITSNGQDVSSDIYWMFDRLQGSGIDGFMVDVWWGLTEPSPKNYIWEGYRKLFELAKTRSWKVQIVASFHQCGGNVGDDCFIPIPNWIPRSGILYTDQSGNENPEYISLWADNVKLEPVSSQLSIASTCSAPDNSKVDCGFSGIDQGGCEARGCCWVPSNTPGTPWCFNQQGGGDGTCALSDPSKQDCGYMGIDENGCVAKGCCWAESSSGAPWCYYRGDSPPPTPPTPTPTPPTPTPTPPTPTPTPPTPTPTPPSPTGSRTPIEMYSDWFAAFAEAFSQELGSTIIEVMVGMGPAGELRYPAYPLKYWNFCGVGGFQSFDQHARESLSNHAAANGRSDWGTPFSRNVVGDYNSQPPSSTQFFSDVYQQDQGRFFLDWYFESLKAHGQRVLSAADAVFGAYSGVHLAGKIAGIHWWYGDASHAAEVTAGYYNTNARNGYAELAEMFKANGQTTFCFTCLEMRNYEQPSSCSSAPESLVRQTIEAASSKGVPYAGENALPRYDRSAYDQIVSNKGSMSAFTYLRLNPTLLDGQNFDEFTRFVNLMHR